MTNQIRRLRAAQGLTREKLAHMLGMSPSQLSRLETGSRRLNADTIRQIAAALGTSPAEILAGPVELPVIGTYDPTGEVLTYDPTVGPLQTVRIPSIAGVDLAVLKPSSESQYSLLFIFDRSRPLTGEQRLGRLGLCFCQLGERRLLRYLTGLDHDSFMASYDNVEPEILQGVGRVFAVEWLRPCRDLN